MPNAAPIQSNFQTGEISPLLFGRVDNERYKAALARCLNYLPTAQGGLIRRPGSYYVAPVETSSKVSRLMPFEFSTTQAYILEFADQKLRFYRNNAPVLESTVVITGITQANPAVVTANAHGYSNGDQVEIAGVVGMTQVNGRRFTVANVAANTFELSGVNSTGYTAYSSGGTVARVYTIATPWPESVLFQLKFTQSADVLYVVHPSYAPYKVTRTAHTSWTATAITFLDGPYLDTQQINNGTRATTITVTPSATTGANITLTASAALWTFPTDIGRIVRIKHSSTWGYARIITDAGNSTTVAHATVVNAFGATTASSNWRLGAWSDTTGYPGSTVFHEDRLFFSGPSFFPQRFDGSNTGDYENFAPSSVADVISNSNALNFSLNANDVNVIRWMTTDEKGLLLGTTGGEWVARPSSQSEGLSPTNISVKRASSYGSANIQPVQVGRATMYIQRSSKKLRELTYFYDVDGFQANDMSLLAEHVTGPGITQLAYQKEPQSIIWAVRSDGVLCGLSYERDIEKVNAGWSRHLFGGVGDAAGNDAIVESVAAIPSSDGTSEELWLTVKRRINGATVRYVEYLTALFDDRTDQQDAFFVDSGLTYDSPVTITGATAANPVVITANSHGFSNGDTVRIAEVAGMTELNGETFTVANVAANTFELSGINGTAYTAYISGGEVRKEVLTISGLWHLIGQSVSILADGAVLPNATVSATGGITLSTKSTVVQVGLGYDSEGQLPRLDAGSANGTSIGKTRRTHRVGFLLHRTLGLKLGTDFDALDEVTFRTSSDSMSRAPALFTGIHSTLIQNTYDFENQICWRQDQPLPGLFLAIMPQMVVQDRI